MLKLYLLSFDVGNNHQKLDNLYVDRVEDWKANNEVSWINKILWQPLLSFTSLI